MLERCCSATKGGGFNGSVPVLGILQEPGVRPVWRLAFFSRFEERKGLKVFVKALAQLQAGAGGGEGQQPALDARFEVHFVGAEARIDMRPSTDWLRAKTAAWK